MDIANDLLDMSKDSRSAIISDCSVNGPHLSFPSPIFYDTTHAPIDTLPNEVLSLIFRILARHQAGRSILSGLCQCVVLLKVCRRWHALVMNDGFLWSFVDTTMWGPREWNLKTYNRVKNQVKRARNCPLHLSHHSSRSLFWIEDMAAPLMNLKSLHLGVDLPDVRKVMELMGDERPARLEKLHISCKGSKEGDGDGDVYSLPSAIVEALPSLHRLVLNNVYVTLTSLPHNLTELSLSGPVSLMRRYEIHEFFQVLAELSYLEILCIELIVVKNDSPNGPLPIVKLPHLQSLSISSLFHIINYFLANIHAHPDVRIKSTAYSCIEQSQDMYDVSEFILYPLISRFRRPKTLAYTSRIRALVVDNGTDFPENTHLYGYDHTDVSRVTRCRNSQDGATDGLLDFMFFAQRGKYRIRAGRRIFRTIMTDVRVLEVRAGSGVEATMPTVGWWRMTLWSLVSLEAVYVSADAQTCASFCQALGSLVEQRPRNFPKLRRVYLHKSSQEKNGWWRWGAGVSLGSDVTDPLELPRRNFEEVIRVARMYKEAGYGAFEVVMTCNSDFGYWPGLDKTRELKDVVAGFSYIEMVK